MAIVLQLPPRNYQFLALEIIVYWAIVAGHAASGYSFLVGIPLLPLLVIQIVLLYHIWSTLTKRLSHKPESPKPNGVSTAHL